MTDRLPPSELSSAVVLSLADLALAVFVPWLVLGGAVPRRLLLPGGCLFDLVMMVLRPVASVMLPRAMDVSVERYGTIGLAFTYVGWLYVLSFALLATAVVGQVLARDPGCEAPRTGTPRPGAGAAPGRPRRRAGSPSVLTRSG